MMERWPSEALLVYVDRLYEAVAARDAASVTRMLRLQMATQLPRDVREDVLATTRAPRDSFRAPMRLLQFRHRMMQLGTGEATPSVGQFELELRPRPKSVRRHTTSSGSQRGSWKRRGRE